MLRDAEDREWERETVRERREILLMFVFGYWQTRFQMPHAKYDKKRRALLWERFTEGGGNASELLYAIDGAKKDPWYNGDNKDGIARPRLEVILGSRSVVEELAARSPGFRKGEPHPQLAKINEKLNGG